MLQGLLDLLVLRILSNSEGLHGYAIAECVRTTSGDILRVEEGSLYPALHRMQAAGWVTSEWRTSALNRRARYYRVTARGRKHLAQLEQPWTAHVQGVMRVHGHHRRATTRPTVWAGHPSSGGDRLVAMSTGRAEGRARVDVGHHGVCVFAPKGGPTVGGIRSVEALLRFTACDVCGPSNSRV